MKTFNNKISREWIIVGLSFFMILLTIGIYFSFGAYLINLSEELNCSRSDISLVFSLSLVVYSAFMVVMGILSDRYGIERTICVGGILFGIGYILGGFSTKIWILCFCFGVVAIGLAGVFIPSVSVPSKSFKNNKGLAIGIIMSGGGLGPFLITPLVTYLVLLLDWRNTFFIQVTTCIILTVMITYFMKTMEVPSLKPKPVEKQESLVDAEISWNLNQVLKNYMFWLIYFVYVLTSIGFTVVVVHLFPYLIGKGLSAILAGYILGQVGIGRGCGAPLAGFLSDRFGRKIIMFYLLTLQGLLIIALTFTIPVYAYFIAAFFYGISVGGMVSQFPAIAVDFYGYKFLGSIFGVLNTAFGLGGAFGAFIAGFFFDLFNTYNYTYYICGILYGVGILLIIFIKKPDAR